MTWLCPDSLRAVEDIIEVREDERIDRDALRQWIDEIDELPSGTPQISQFAGGKANLTYLLVFPNGG
jgi:aminoglycoside phosphotransferase (APT) family kinase protein